MNNHIGKWTYNGRDIHNGYSGQRIVGGVTWESPVRQLYILVSGSDYNFYTPHGRKVALYNIEHQTQGVRWPYSPQLMHQYSSSGVTAMVNWGLLTEPQTAAYYRKVWGEWLVNHWAVCIHPLDGYHINYDDLHMELIDIKGISVSRADMVVVLKAVKGYMNHLAGDHNEFVTQVEPMSTKDYYDMVRPAKVDDGKLVWGDETAVRLFFEGVLDLAKEEAAV